MDPDLPLPEDPHHRHGLPAGLAHTVEGELAGAARRIVTDVEHVEQLVLPAWLRLTKPENRLPVAAAVLVAAVLQFALPQRYGISPRWLLPGLEVTLLAVVVAINPVRLERSNSFGRYASIALVFAITLGNGLAAGLLDANILNGKASGDATGLLADGASIYLTNIIAFGIWYWELDRGGPLARLDGRNPHPDFLFPQMGLEHLAPAGWRPEFLDYLYVSFTNVMAFSPTDTLPLSRWAKTLMAIQSMIALSTTALVIARAINILK